MADEASNTLSGGIRNYLGTLGFILPLVGLEEFIRSLVSDQPSLPHWASVTLVVAGLPLYVAPWVWDCLRHLFWPEETDPQELEYLNRDSELGSAIQTMTRVSAWGRWYAAQVLVNKGQPAGEDEVLHAASFNVLEKIANGVLDVRGRLPEEMDYKPIPRTYWRSSALHFIPNNVSLWKLVIIPRGGAEIEPDGNVIAHNAEAAARTAHITNYDSLIVDGLQFEHIWPKQDRETDKARRQLLRQARRRKLDSNELRRLSDPPIWQRIGLLLGGLFVVGLAIGSAITVWATLTRNPPSTNPGVQTVQPPPTAPPKKNSIPIQTKAAWQRPCMLFRQS